MELPPIASELLAFQAMPDLARALAIRKERIIERWQQVVQDVLPDANPLTRQEVRDSIPRVLDHLIQALEGGDPHRVSKLAETTKDHGKVRFDQAYDFHEFLTEYRILNQIVVEEVGDQLGGSFSAAQAGALVAGLDIAAEQGAANFVAHLSARLRSSAEGEIRFMSFLSHDLRNNLNLVLLTLELLEARLSTYPDLAEEARELATAQRAARATVHGMERLLQAERLRNRTEPPRRVLVDLPGLLDEIRQEFARPAETKGIRLEQHVDPGVTLYSDREILSIVLRNLVGNAVKYSSGGTVQVHVGRTDTPSQSVIIQVADQGPGIAPEHRHRLFEVFQRGESYGQKGIGLGLAIASQCARLLGAELTVESAVGKGSTFSLRFGPQATEFPDEGA